MNEMLISTDERPLRKGRAMPARQVTGGWENEPGIGAPDDR